MQNAVAFTNNDIVMIAWSYGKRPTGCMGFAIHRIDQKGKEAPLPSHAVFKGFTIKPGQTTDSFPIQKFYWKDPYARPIAEKTGNRRFCYKIIPLEGTPGSLRPMGTLPTIITNEVTISPEISNGVYAYFNRGLISTQRISKAFKGKPQKGSLVARISDKSDDLRASLSGDMVEALTEFVDRAKKTGIIHAALYELCDEELIQKLEGLGSRLEIILSNSVETDEDTGKKVDGNREARKRLEKTAKTLINRIMPSNHIGHNKFLVYVDKGGEPKSVLFGSTNWTTTGLCTQTNNTMVVENSSIAGRYLDYWKKLATDTKQAGDDPRELQGAALRKWDGQSRRFSLAQETIDSWFSPNTPKSRGKPSVDEECPPDMSAVINLINNAKQAVLFLAFYPGMPCVSQWAADALKRNRNLFVRGCVTNKSASEGFYYQLKGVTPPKRKKGEKKSYTQDPRVIGAEAFDGKIIPKGWLKEILKAGFAIIHDKIIVIDPFSDECVVVTGSHNLGYKASYNNDENLAIIKGNKKLAVAYATHVLDVYDHFSWRYSVKQYGEKGAEQSLKDTPDQWLDQYYDRNGEIKTAQLKFWMQSAG